MLRGSRRRLPWMPIAPAVLLRECQGVSAPAGPDRAAGAPRGYRPLRRRLADVDQPRHAELVGAHAELIAPGLLLHRHRDGPAVGQPVPVAAQDVGVVAA